ncbi:MAG TPA: peptidylprolyl isomerase [Burkholderiaceae bacterium]
MTDPLRAARAFLLSLAIGLALPWAAAQPAPRAGDYIVAIVNQELVTAGEVQLRMAQVRAEARRSGARLPPDPELRKQVVEALIEERVLVTYARDSGVKIDEADLDRAVANIAQQNQVTMAQLRERLQREGLDYKRFRDSVRDQLMVERTREREVQSRIKVSEAEVDDFLDKQRAKAPVELDIAQILVTVPDGASVEEVARRRALAEQAQARVRNGEDFARVAREMSEDGNRQQGGEIGLKAADRLPDVFVAAVRGLQPGEVAPTLLRTGAGFHLLKLLERRDGSSFAVTQTHARHILLRPGPQLSQDAAIQRLAGFKRDILAGKADFEALARANSEDGSAAAGGDLGWVSAGNLVPEFEEAMNELPVNGISDPVVTRFGVHLIQVVERRSVKLDAKQLREQARNVLREQKFEQAYNEWLRDLRARAYVEMREPPVS